MGKERIPGLKFVVTRVIPRLGYRLNLDPSVNKVIKETKKFLKKNPDWSLLIGQNHLTEDDPLFGGYISSRMDPRNSRYAFAPTSALHSEKVEGKKRSKKGLMNDVVQKCGVETIPVVQSYQIDNPDYNFTKKDANKRNIYFARRMRDLSKSEKPLCCVLMPEGHRSDDGILGKAEKGIEHIVKNMRPVRIIPLAISSPDKLDRDKMNFGKRINLSIGDIIDCGVSEEIDVNNFMRNLARALPPKMRGEYGE